MKKTNQKYKPYTFTSKSKKYKTNHKQKTYKSTQTYPIKKHDPWLDGTFEIDPQTWKTKCILKK